MIAALTWSVVTYAVVALCLLVIGFHTLRNERTTHGRIVGAQFTLVGSALWPALLIYVAWLWVGFSVQWAIRRFGR